MAASRPNRWPSAQPVRRNETTGLSFAASAPLWDHGTGRPVPCGTPVSAVASAPWSTPPARPRGTSPNHAAPPFVPLVLPFVPRALPFVQLVLPLVPLALPLFSMCCLSDLRYSAMPLFSKAPHNRYRLCSTSCRTAHRCSARPEFVTAVIQHCAVVQPCAAVQHCVSFSTA